MVAMDTEPSIGSEAQEMKRSAEAGLGVQTNVRMRRMERGH
jgi:hypothetical protein